MERLCSRRTLQRHRQAGQVCPHQAEVIAVLGQLLRRRALQLVDREQLQPALRRHSVRQTRAQARLNEHVPKAHRRHLFRQICQFAGRRLRLRRQACNSHLLKAITPRQVAVRRVRRNKRSPPARTQTRRESNIERFQIAASSP